VLSQQDKNVLPSCVGQHKSPAPKPSSWHRQCMPQSLAAVGAAVVGDDVGALVALHRGVIPGSQTPLWQSSPLLQSCPAAHFVGQTPPQSTSASLSSFSQLPHPSLSQQLAKEPSPSGQHTAPGANVNLAQRGCTRQSASVVGEKEGELLGLPVGANVGDVDGATVGDVVGRSVLHVPSALQSPLSQSRGPSVHFFPARHGRQAPPPQSTDVSSPFRMSS
jgi:hypothetical protein